MQYFVTGATGFIGRHLMGQLARRGGTFHVLVREESRDKLHQRATEWGIPAEQLRPVVGDLSRPGLGVSEADLDALRGQVDHAFHLAAIYDMDVDDLTAQRVNVEGTRAVLDVLRTIGVNEAFHHVSSIAVAGAFRGNFLEAMFDEGQPLDNAYFRTKFESERLVREVTDFPWRVYRPGIVVGHSRTGEMDKVDGPYYFFKTIQRLRNALPQWMPLVGVEGGAVPMVPVDFVAATLDYIAHTPGQDGKTFHITDPHARSLGDAVNTFCRAAHAPEFAMRIDLRHFRRMLPTALANTVKMIPAVQTLWRAFLDDLEVPASVAGYVMNPTTYDTREMETVLRGSGLGCPPLESYAPQLWDYWERRMDPALHKRRNLDEFLPDKVVVVTGASSGIGRAVALRLAKHGARVLAIARSMDKLEELADEARAAGADVQPYPTDLTDLDACDAVARRILDDHDHVDILINNAGRSIRRSVKLTIEQDRFHDYQRTMQLNFFGALKLTLGFLPRMRARKFGHVINVSSIGVQAGAARFSAYIASKAALDTFARSLACEVSDENVHITTVYMPLVQTPMIAPTRLYENMPTMDVKQAADMVVDAILARPKKVTTRLGTFAEVLNAVMPRMADRVQNLVFRIVPESSAAKGESIDQPQEVPVEAVVLANILRGMHL